MAKYIWLRCLFLRNGFVCHILVLPPKPRSTHKNAQKRIITHNRPTRPAKNTTPTPARRARPPPPPQKKKRERETAHPPPPHPPPPTTQKKQKKTHPPPPAPPPPPQTPPPPPRGGGPRPHSAKI